MKHVVLTTKCHGCIVSDKSDEAQMPHCELK